MRARPGDGARLRPTERFGLDLPGRRAVVTAGDASRAGVAKERDALARPGVLADDIAEADNAIDAMRGDGVERGLQRLDIGVNLGQDRELHGLARLSFRAAPLCFLSAFAGDVADVVEGAARHKAFSDFDPIRERTSAANRHSHGVCLMSRLV
jgi:hypothetical protein